MSDRMSRPVLAAVVSATAVVVVLAPAFALGLLGDRGEASFGDSTTIGRNRLAAARLDIEIGDRTVALQGVSLAPGDVVTGSLELVNAGTVPLRYSLTVVSEAGRLGPWLTWRFRPSPTGSCPSVNEWQTERDGVIVVDGEDLADGELDVVGARTTGADPGDRVLETGATEWLCIAATIALDAPNSVQETTTDLRMIASAEQLSTNTGEPAP